MYKYELWIMSIVQIKYQFGKSQCASEIEELFSKEMWLATTIGKYAGGEIGEISDAPLRRERK